MWLSGWRCFAGKRSRFPLSYVARCQLQRGYFAEDRCDATALLDGHWAARCERAARLRVNYLGGLARVSRLGQVEGGARVGRGTEQQLGIGVPGIRQDLFSWPLFDDAARVHYEDPVRDVTSTCNIVSYVEEGDPLLFA